MRSWTGLLVMFVVVCTGLLGLRTFCSVDTSQRAFEFMPDMVRSAAGRTQSASAAMASGMVQQAIEKDVVVMGSEDFDFGRGPEECARAGRELSSPLAGTTSEDADAQLYQRFCTPCHGASGDGVGRVVERGMVPSPSFKAARALSLKDGELFHIITRGQNNMAPHGPQIAPLDRWRIVRHLRALQGASR